MTKVLIIMMGDGFFVSNVIIEGLDLREAALSVNQFTWVSR
jgi:hypothetical protein